MFGAAAPDGHPNRCLWGISKGRQCRRYRSAEHHKFCVHHARRVRSRPIAKIDQLPHFYSNVLSATLNEAISADLAMSPDEQFSLSVELSLVRKLAEQALEQWVAVSSIPVFDVKANPEHANAEKTRQELVQGARVAVDLALKSVKDFSVDAAKIYANVKDKCNIHTVQAIVNQVVRLHYESLVDSPDALKYGERFEQLIKDRLKLPQLASAVGTSITADATVTAMDDSIPAGPDVDDDFKLKL